MDEIEIFKILYQKLKYEQSFGLSIIARDKKLVAELKKKLLDKKVQEKQASATSATGSGYSKQKNLEKITEALNKSLDKQQKNNSTNVKIADSEKQKEEDEINNDLPKIKIVVNKQKASSKNQKKSNFINVQNGENNHMIFEMSPEEKQESIKDLTEQITTCERCEILVSQRNEIVPGEGNINSPLMFIGEAPGADEDKSGRPFIGRAGKKLTEIIENGMKIPRKEVFIGNILKCRPPKNRDPQPDEIVNCEGYLRRQIEIIHPKIIIALGAYSARFLLDKPPTFQLYKMRSIIHQYRDTDIKVAVTYHPSYLIQYYTDTNRKKVHEDTQMVVKFLKDEGFYPWW